VTTRCLCKRRPLRAAEKFLGILEGKRKQRGKATAESPRSEGKSRLREAEVRRDHEAVVGAIVAGRLLLVMHQALIAVAVLIVAAVKALVITIAIKNPLRSAVTVVEVAAVIRKRKKGGRKRRIGRNTIVKRRNRRRIRGINPREIVAQM
jgi:hypothetical protein